MATDAQKYMKFSEAMTGLADANNGLERLRNQLHSGSVSNLEATFVIDEATPAIKKAIDALHAECNRLEETVLR